MDDQRKNSENQTEDERATLSVPPPSFRERMLAARRAQEREARRPAATESGEGKEKEIENASETLRVPPPNLKERIRAARRARQIEVKPSTSIPVPPREAVPDRPPDSPEKESAG